ncbi:hypothetical protein PFISCL1PPCAC_9697, partial [Pristionchus fissidentatus]
EKMVLTGNDTKVLKQGDAEPPLAPGKARVYSMRFCPWAERVVLYAAAKGIDAEVVNIDLHSQPDWYKEKKHPKGQVPAFEKDGKVVIESGIIPEYLDGIYPESSILPTDPYEKAQQRLVMEQFQPFWMTFYGLFVIVKEQLEGEARQAKFRALEGVIDNVEKNVLKKEYFGGSAPGFSDWMVFPFIERLELFSKFLDPPTPFPSVERWPKLSKWWSLISAVPEIQPYIQPEDIHIKFLEAYKAVKEYKDAKPDYDMGLH